MLRRGPWKFVHSPLDPDQLYRLDLDPHETRNLVANPEFAAQVAALRAEVAARWDLQALDARVRASQRRRHFLFEALQRGSFQPWDHQPVRDASQLYMRNHIDLDDLEARARFPAVRRAAL
jgi:choline-sulfatase